MHLRLSLLLMIVLVGACAEEPAPNPRAVQLPAEPLVIDNPARYREPGVYEDLRSRGIYLSSDGRMLVALSAACPHDQCRVVYEPMGNQFKCPCCARRFTDMGLARGSPPGTPRAMHRLHIEPTAPEATNPPLRISPRVSYAQEKNQWSYRYSLYMFEER